MRVLFLLLALLVVAQPLTASAGERAKARHAVIPGGTPVLRGPQTVEAGSYPPPLAISAATPAPGRSFSTLSSHGLQDGALSVGGLGKGLSAPGLPSAFASASEAGVCRSGCAATRYQCLTTDDDGCDPRWAQCLAACSLPARP